MPAPRLQSRARASVCRVESSRGFTLIELLAVIAIIGVLAALTFGVVRGVRERSALSRARADLAVLATALESYKRQYGDYPWTTGNGASEGASISAQVALTANEARLFNGLVGKLGPKGAAIEAKSWIEFGRFALESTAAADLPAPTGATAVRNSFLDPWNRRYLYFYKDTGNAATWTQPSYVLVSAGPDGVVKTSDPTAAGIVDDAHADNLDNIYANR